MRPVVPIVGGPEVERRRGFRALLFAYGGGLAAALATGNAMRGHGPLLITILADLAATVAVFIFSKGLDNSSVYDPYWSAAPIPASSSTGVAGWEGPGGALGPPRVGLGNAAHRQPDPSLARSRARGLSLRGDPRKDGCAYWPVSFLTIHLFPTAWALLGPSPLYPALSRPSFPFGLLDGVAAALTAFAILLEAAADLRLRRFLRERRDQGEVWRRESGHTSDTPTTSARSSSGGGFACLAWRRLGGGGPWPSRRAHRPCACDALRRSRCRSPWQGGASPYRAA